MRLGTDTRGKLGAMGVVALVVGLTVGTILAALVLPIGVGQLTDDSSTTLTQNESETVTVTPGLNATLDNATADTEADYTLEAGGDSASVTVSEGGNETATLDGETVTVNADNVEADNATTTYEYPPEMGWSDGSQALWGILDVIIVLAVFLTFIAIAMAASNRV